MKNAEKPFLGDKAKNAIRGLFLWCVILIVFAVVAVFDVKIKEARALDFGDLMDAYGGKQFYDFGINNRDEGSESRRQASKEYTEEEVEIMEEVLSSIIENAAEEMVISGRIAPRHEPVMINDLKKLCGITK